MRRGPSQHLSIYVVLLKDIVASRKPWQALSSACKGRGSIRQSDKEERVELRLTSDD